MNIDNLNPEYDFFQDMQNKQQIQKFYIVELDLSRVQPILYQSHPGFEITDKLIGKGNYGEVFEACKVQTPITSTIMSPKIPTPISFNQSSSSSKISKIPTVISFNQSSLSNVKDCNYAAKILKTTSAIDENKDDVRWCLNTKEANSQETSVAKVLSDIGVGPKIYNIYNGNNLKNYPEHTNEDDVIVMEKFDGNVTQLLKTNIENSNELEKQIHPIIDNLILKMHNAGIVHRDLNTDNILYKYVNGNLVLAISDTGLSIFSNDKEIQKDDLLHAYPPIEFTRNGQPCTDWQ
jgi:serine/threonine protein kinase